MFGALVGAASGLIGASSASRAASAQAAASREQVELSRDVYNDQKKALAPYRGGDMAINALMYELGLGSAPVIGGTAPEITRRQIGQSSGPSFDDWLLQNGYGSAPSWEKDEESRALNKWRSAGGGEPAYEYQVGGQTFGSRGEAQKWANANPTGGTAYQGYQKTPGYDFRLQAGQDAVSASVGGRHGLNSGATLKALTEHNQNFATNEYGNFYNRLAGMAAGNQAAAGGQVAAAGQYANNANNALANLGNAQASGAIGVGNALVGGINNGLGVWAYGKERGWG